MTLKYTIQPHDEGFSLWAMAGSQLVSKTFVYVSMDDAISQMDAYVEEVQRKRPLRR